MDKRFRAFKTTRDYQALQKSLPGWYRIIRNAAGPAQVTIYDEIGFLGVSADSFRNDLAGVDGDIDLHINSPGGDVFDGIAIYNQLKQRPGTVSVTVDGWAASAASFIAQAASPGKLAIAPHAAMMIHDGHAMAIGNAADYRKMADDLEMASANIAGIYADRTGKPADYWRGLMKNETWLYDYDAVTEGLADYVVGKEQPQNQWDFSVYDHAPDPGAPKKTRKRPKNEKYSADDRKALAAKGHAMPDGSYPIADEEDLHNAIHAVGRGGSDHDAIRRHIIKRAAALGASGSIPDNWNADGSLGTDSSPDNLSEAQILALFARELDQLDAGRE